MKQILDTDQIFRTIKRIAHEIMEKNDNLNDVILVGIKNKGVPLAKKLQDIVYMFSNVRINLIELDVTNYRDDIEFKEHNPKFDAVLRDKVVILVDDVLYTGRTIRAAMDACMDLGRAKRIQLAVLIDRGHRELPIRPDYVGKNIPTSKSEKIIVDLTDLKVFLEGDRKDE